MKNPHPLDDLARRKEYYRIHKSFKGYKTYIKLLEDEKRKENK